MENTRPINKILSTYHYWCDYLNKLRNEGRQAGISSEDKKEIRRQKINIIGSFITAAGVTGFCVICILLFLSVILYGTKNSAEEEKTSKEIEVSKIIAEYPEIYNRVRYEHGDIYLLSKNIAEGFKTKEEKILAVYQYIRERVQYIEDGLPKPIFYFPDETLEQGKGNSKEQAVLAASLLYFMSIGSEVVLADGKTYLCINDANGKLYKDAIKQLVEENFIFFEDYLTVEKSDPEILIVPKRLDGLNLFVGFNAKYPIDIITIKKNATIDDKCSKTKTASGVIECKYAYGDKITLTADEHPLVEVLITISTHRNEIIKMMPPTDVSGNMVVHLDFTNKNIKALSGTAPFDETNSTRLPIIPEMLW